MRRSSGKTPYQIELVITLITEDLRKRKFFIDHYHLDFEGDPWFESDLGKFVLKSIGFNEITKDVLNFYLDLIDQHCRPMPELELDEAFGVYVELVRRKEKEDEEDSLIS